MLRWIIALAVLAAPTTAAAEPVVLLCTGTYTPQAEPFADRNLVESRNASFEVIVDAEKGTVQENGRPMVVRSFSDEKIVYAFYKPGLASLVDNVTTISRTTGVYRTKSGNGTCQVREAKKLF